MAKATEPSRDEGRVEWMRWLHDPRHWERFYDEVATETFAAISKEMWDGKWPDEAVDLAVEDMTAKMRAEGVPEDVVVAYREDYLKHRSQLIEVANEIGDVMPDEAPTPEPEPMPAAETAALARLPVLLPLWFAKTFWGGIAHLLREMETWGHQAPPVVERRHPERAREEAGLVGQTGRRRRDLNVERL